MAMLERTSGLTNGLQGRLDPTGSMMSSGMEWSQNGIKRNEMQWAGCSFLCFRAAAATQNNHGRVGTHLAMDSFSVPMTRVHQNEGEPVPPCLG